MKVTHLLGLSSQSSETTPVGLLKTASASTTILPPPADNGESSSNSSGSRLVLRFQEGNRVREHFNYNGQGEENYVFYTTFTIFL